jgi:serine/threonine protein kinase
MNEKMEFPDETNVLLENLILGMLQVDPKKRMPLSDVMNHDYVLQAVLLEFPQFEPFHPPRYNSDLPVEEITGIVCDESYSFAQSYRSCKSQIYSLSNQC